MASKTTLNEKNLEALGAERLAALLMEITSGNANAKRRLRMELAGVESPEKLVNEIRKRLTSIGNATTNIGWRSLKAFKTDLDTQRKLIVDQVAKASPGDAMDLMWTFLELSTSVLERTTDNSGEVIGIFRQANNDLAILAVPAPKLVDRLVVAILCNTYGQSDGLITRLAPILGTDGLNQLRQRLNGAEKQPERKPVLRARRTARWRRGRTLERDVVLRRSRQQVVQQARLEIADAMGDVDAYVALQTDLRLPQTAARVAERLLKAGRSEEALKTLEGVRAKEPRPPEWNAARIAALEALGRDDAAQAFRMEVFRETLDRDVLKAHLKRLPDFDDIEAEDAALDYVVTFPRGGEALDFLLTWPSLDRAATLVTTRPNAVGADDDVLPVAAEKLAARYPLAAVVILRRMIDSILNGYRSAEYEKAADYLTEVRRLAAHIDDFAGFPDHEAYVAGLRTHHGRKADFWNAVG
jgi:hypothetical protein